MLKNLLGNKMLSILSILIFVFLLTNIFLLTPRDRGVIFSRKKSFDHGNFKRTYLESRPSNFTGDSKIIVGLHGFSDTPRRFAYYTSLHNTVGPNDLVIYPSAIPAQSNDEKIGWNSGFCCGSGWINKVDDSGFIKALVESLIEKYGIKKDMVYVTGFSNGGFMTQRLLTDHPEVFSAGAVNSGSIGTVESRLEPKSPVPILLIHGEKDTIVPYSGGIGSSDPDFTWLDFSKTAKVWQTVNGSEAETKIITHPEDGHKWHDWRLLNIWNKKPQGTKDVVEFFNKY